MVACGVARILQSLVTLDRRNLQTSMTGARIAAKRFRVTNFYLIILITTSLILTFYTLLYNRKSRCFWDHVRDLSITRNCIRDQTSRFVRDLVVKCCRCQSVISNVALSFSQAAEKIVRILSQFYYSAFLHFFYITPFFMYLIDLAN